MLYYLSRRRLPLSESDIDRMEKKAHLIQQLNMCQAFTAAGQDVCFVSPGSESPSWRLISDYYGLTSQFDFRAVRTPSKNHTFPNYPIPDTDDQALAYWLLYMYLSNNFESGDIIYSRNPTPTRYFLAFLDWIGAGDDISVWFEQHQVDRGLGRAFYDRLDGVVCISHRQKEQMLHTVEEADLYVAHDGVDLQAYDGISTASARERLGFDADERIVMYTGHLYPSKSVDTLVAAAADFDAQCYIVGGYEEDISRIRSERDVPDNVTFTGFVPPSEVPFYQMAADILVSTVAADTGKYEFFSPLKIFEYMATGNPSVVSRKPAFEEVLSHGENSLFVEPESATALASSVRKLLSEPELRAELGRQARQDSKQYRWTTRARRILDEIQSGTDGDRSAGSVVTGSLF